MGISLDSLPRCGELLWLNLFNLVNFIFCVTALLQTTIVVRLVSHKKACDAAVPSAAVAAGVVPAAAAAGEDHGCVCGDRKKIAKKIDFWSRRCIPVAYFFSVWFVYGLTLVDSYSISSTDGRVSKDDVVSSLPMYQGLAPDYEVDAGRVIIGVVVSVILICATSMKELTPSLYEKLWSLVGSGCHNGSSATIVPHPAQ